MRPAQIAYEMLRKEAEGVTKGLLAAAKGFLLSGKEVSRHMAAAGVKSPVAHAAAKLAPAAAAVYAGKKAYESEPAQRLRYRVALWKHNRALKKAQEQGGY